MEFDGYLEPCQFSSFSPQSDCHVYRPAYVLAPVTIYVEPTDIKGRYMLRWEPTDQTELFDPMEYSAKNMKSIGRYADCKHDIPKYELMTSHKPLMRQTVTNALVEILACKQCGDVSIAWSKTTMSNVTYG